MHALCQKVLHDNFTSVFLTIFFFLRFCILFSALFCGFEMLMVEMICGL